ncbi:MAG TPA: hypothetical protein VL992_14225 [Tepidisphaeraceae bacterium]|nr:hypothetical protein [Tepidisphaeraceae bacterium]
MPEEVLSAPASVKPLALCVLGMHRSGTSALTGLLHLLGVDLGRHLMKPGRGNPSGFWEYKPIVDAQIALLSAIGSTDDDYLPLPEGWERRPAALAFQHEIQELVWKEFAGKKMWAFKDPRTCRLLPMWHSIFLTLRMDSRFILILRDPTEIAANWMAGDSQRYIKTSLMTLTHMLQSERHTRGHKRVLVTYDQVLTDWKATMDKVASVLQIQWPRTMDSATSRISEFINPSLRHHRVADPAKSENALIEGGCDPQIARWTFAVYNALFAAATGSDAEETLKKSQPFLDRIAEDFNRVAPAYLHWRPMGTPWWMPLTG